MNERALAEKINLHLQIGAATPGFHLNEDDLCMIVRALQRGHAQSSKDTMKVALELALEYIEADLRERFSVSGQNVRDEIRAALSDTSTDHRCHRCGCETKGEMAWVDGQIWCHPCADLTNDI